MTWDKGVFGMVVISSITIASLYRIPKSDRLKRIKKKGEREKWARPTDHHMR